MKKIAIYGRTFLTAAQKNGLQQLVDIFNNRGIDIFFERNFGVFLKEKFQWDIKSFDAGDITNFEFLVSFGGDGTVLDTLKIVKETEIPVIPINMGRMGFLANINLKDVEFVLDAIAKKDYHILKKRVLKVENSHENIAFPYALNDFVIQKRDTSSMISVEVFSGKSLLNIYWSDGLIVATPTGSSGYSLSCGGPLIAPGSDSFVVTPIAAHNLTVRPVVMPASSELTLKIKSRNETVLVSIDADSFVIDAHSVFKISKADFSFCVLTLNDSSYFQTLRDKLFWGVDLRNNP
jgi:NAD+ kinase